MSPNTPISRDEQITAIKNMAEEYDSLSVISTTPTHVAAMLSDTSEAAELTTRYRVAGWWSATANKANYSDKWIVRVALNTN